VPSLQRSGALGVAHDQCKIISGTDAADGIAVVVVLCKRCGYLMTLAADQIPKTSTKSKARSA
jgi:hypothetical protein